ncbi:aconitase family protein [Mesoterricola sediminis]|uniref:aconitase family protein n=1 Tax=Mesoterricola sediminis TaxID=2927980 RepID=UPI001FAE7662|nr:aconitase family protein [Mesoterricola sediminis]
MKVDGRVLLLSEDPARLRSQFQGEDLRVGVTALRDYVTVDEIAPGWVCFYFGQRLGDFAYLGCLCGGTFPMHEGFIKRGGFQVVVSGKRHGGGGPREAAPYAERAAGIRLVIAESFDPAYRQQCHALGLLTSTDMGLVERIRQGEDLPMDLFTRGLDALTAEIVRAGGIFEYTQARLREEARLPEVSRAPRPMTYGEKLLARAARHGFGYDACGLEAVAPGDGILVKADWRFSHETVTPLAVAMVKDRLGEGVPFEDTHSILAFRDHLTFLGRFYTQDQGQPGIADAARRIKRMQEEFCAANGIRLHGEDAETGCEGICHVLMAERYALPGQVIVGTDSHTSHSGALGALAFGVGAADIACAWVTGDVRVTVPPSVLVKLKGRLGPGVFAKDLVLHLLTLPFFRDGHVKGRIIEYEGEALAGLGTDERATLTNMAADSGAFAGIIAPDAETVRYVEERRGRRIGLVPWMRSDPGAVYEGELEVDCSAVTPMLASPGFAGNGLPLAALDRQVDVDIAYVGSCTGAKREDLERVYEVVSWGLARGMTVPLRVQFFIQLGSEDVRAHAEAQGWLRAFDEAGARILDPGCGACINAGPGVSTRPDQVTISAINRNNPGRSGPGQVWLASPATVAASALKGYICGADTLMGTP